MSFIQIKVLHPHDPELDTVVAINVDNIVVVGKATSQERKQRAEIQSTVILDTNQFYATTETLEELLEKIQHADF